MKEVKLKDLKSRLFERSGLDERKLKEMAESIAKVGVAQPILVRPTEKGYELVIGSRRVEASKKAGVREIPAVVSDIPDRDAFEFILAENIHREDLSGVDKGRICKLLLDRFPERYPSQEALAERIGVRQQTIAKWLSITSMPVEARRLIAPETEKRVVPMGKVDYDTAFQVAKKVKRPKRLASVLKHVAKRRTKRKRALGIAERVAREPEKPIAEIIEETRPEAELIFRHEFKAPILQDKKTQTTRPTYPGVKQGEEVWAHFTESHAFRLRIGGVSRKKLGEFDDSDAEREGFRSLEGFKGAWERLYAEPWNPGKSVYVIRFERA